MHAPKSARPVSVRAQLATIASRVERVAREDLMMFINACFSCSGQREYYSDAKGQAVSIEFLHLYILGNYRRLYARTLAAGINHYNQAIILVNLLATGKDTTERAEEGALIRAALRRLPPQRAFRVLTMLRERRINNRRARAVVKEYLAERPDPTFDAVKYRTKVRAAAIHAHLRLPGETGAFLFRGWKTRTFQTPMFETFRGAHFGASGVFDLPFTIAEGLAAKHKIPRATFLQKIAPRMTTGEKLRMQGAAARETRTTIDLDLTRIGLTKLALYVLSLDEATRTARAGELRAAMDISARRAIAKVPARLGRVAAVLDRSRSASGSSEKRRRPLGVALAASVLLSNAATEYRAFWTTPLDSDELGVTARGQTRLGGPLLDALDWKPDLVVIVSDGFENDPPLGAAEVARVFRSRLDPERKTAIVHMNPVFDAQNYAPRTLGDAIPTVGLRDAEDLLTVLGFARFADGHAPLAELESYLAARMAEMLDAESREATSPHTDVESVLRPEEPAT